MQRGKDLLQVGQIKISEGKKQSNTTNCFTFLNFNQKQSDTTKPFTFLNPMFSSVAVCVSLLRQHSWSGAIVKHLQVIPNHIQSEKENIQKEKCLHCIRDLKVKLIFDPKPHFLKSPLDCFLGDFIHRWKETFWINRWHLDIFTCRYFKILQKDKYLIEFRPIFCHYIYIFCYIQADILVSGPRPSGRLHAWGGQWQDEGQDWVGRLFLKCIIVIRMLTKNCQKSSSHYVYMYFPLKCSLMVSRYHHGMMRGSQVPQLYCRYYQSGYDERGQDLVGTT